MTRILPMLAVLLAALALPARAQTEDALRQGLIEARLVTDQGKLDEARAMLLRLIETHGESDYVLLHVHRIKEGLKRCAFWRDRKTPELEQLISGELRSYNRRNGEIKVRYQREVRKRDAAKKDDMPPGVRMLMELLGQVLSAPSDFTYALGVPMHPIVFAGPYTIEIEGIMPDPEHFFGSWANTPTMVIEAGDEGIYQISFGYPRTETGNYYYSPTPARLVHYAGDRRTVLDEHDSTPLELDKPYSVKITVSSKTITASANGRTFLKGKKEGDAYGRFGFRNCPEVTDLSISGMANTAWLEGLADKWFQDEWRAFDKVYDPIEDLPAKLAERVGTVTKHPTGLLEEYPGGDHAEHDLHLLNLEEFVEKHDYRKIANYLDKLPEGRSTLGFKEYLSARALVVIGEYEEALGHLETVCEAHADFMPATILRVQLLRTLGRGEEAMVTLLALVGGGTRDARPHAELARQLLQDGLFSEARAAMEGSIAAGIVPAELESVAFGITRSLYGPEWSKSFEFKSRNYLVQSDLDARVCSDAAQTLEQSLAMYNGLFGRAEAGEGEPARYAVYLFAGKAGYLAYAQDLFGSAPVNTAGLYSPILKQLLIWNLPDRDMMMRTIRHEGFHQYLDRLVDEPPVWFNEGTAEYFETAELSRGKMTPGAPIPGHVGLLSDPKTQWIPLEELLHMGPARFYRESLAYPQSWAVVHFLLHAQREDKQLFDGYLAALVAGATPREAGDRIFGDRDLGVLLKRVKAHVKGLSRDR